MHRIFWNIFCSSPWSIYKRLRCLSSYAGTLRRQNPLLEVSFYEWETMAWPVKIVTVVTLASCYKLLSEVPSVQGRGSTNKEGGIPVLRTNAKPHQLIKHTKISYSIALLVFRKFSCRTCRNGLNRGTSKLRHSKYSKSTNCVSLIPFFGNPHFSILVHRVRHLKNLFVSGR